MERTQGRLRGMWRVANGWPIFARVTGSYPVTQNPPVVLVHGMVISSSYMVRLGEELSRDCKVYAPDLPGYGRSRAEEVLNLQQLGEALGHWIEAMGIERPVLVGNSFGCQVIAECAVQFPGRASGFVFIGPTVDTSARSLPKLLARWSLEAPFREGSMSPLMLRDYMAAGAKRSLATLQMMLADEIEAKLPRMMEPVLLARGEKDPISPPEWLEELHALTPNSRIRTIPKAAHPANFVEPEETAKVIREFLDEVQAAEAPKYEEATV